MPTTTNDSRRRPLAFWATPATSVVLGAAMAGAAWAAGERGYAIFAALLMVGLAVVLVVASTRSETVRGILDRQDERIAGIDRDATTITGVVIIGAIIVAFIVELARGEDGAPFSWLGAIGGVTYVVALVVLRLRR